MPGVTWTERTVPSTSYQEGRPDISGTTVDFLFGAFVLTQPEFTAVITNYTERTCVSTSYTERPVNSTSYTERTL